MAEVPATLIAGDSWTWEVDLSEYDSGTWTLSYLFANKDAQFEITATGVGTLHTVAELPAATDKTPGRYKWTARVADGTNIYTVGQGWTEITANPTEAVDLRTWARRTLDAVEATLEGKATRDDLAVSINGRSISRYSLAELREWRTELRNQVRVEDESENAGLGRDIGVRFSRV